jgi:hypothetical protein
MQTEDRFTAVKTALQRLNKVDLDKLIYAVRPFLSLDGKPSSHACLGRFVGNSTHDRGQGRRDPSFPDAEPSCSGQNSPCGAICTRGKSLCALTRRSYRMIFNHLLNMAEQERADDLGRAARQDRRPLGCKSERGCDARQGLTSSLSLRRLAGLTGS